MVTSSSCCTWFATTPSVAESITVTFCSVHLRNNVARKRDASTSLLERLRGHMVLRSVDFNGGDFNMSAFSTVGDVFSDPEFAAPGSALLWGTRCLDEACRDCTGFLIMSQHPHLWRVQSRAHCPVILHLRVTNLPGPDSKLNNAVRNGRRERMIANASASSLRSNLHRAQRPRRPSPSQRRSTRLPNHSILLVPATRENIMLTPPRSNPSARCSSAQLEQIATRGRGTGHDSSLLLLLASTRAWTAPILLQGHQ